MTTNSFHAITRALALRAKAELAAHREVARQRPIDTRGISFDFYDRQQRNRPTLDIRWAAWLVTWDGKTWIRRRRL